MSRRAGADAGHVRRTVVLLVVALSAGAAVPGAAAGATEACPRDSRCLNVRVPLDRSGAVAGTVELRAAVTPGRHARSAPLVVLTGGPGQAGVTYTRGWGLLLGLSGVRRTFVTVDVRGSGASGLLRCPGFERALGRSPTPAAGSCALALGPRRAFYRSSDAAEDLEALRTRLNVPRIALLAVSYGTRVAVEYARRFPERTERVILDSPVADDADAFAAETFTAVPRVLRALCAGGCPGGGPRPVGDLQALARRLRDRPIGVAAGGERIRLDEVTLLETLVATDLDPDEMRRFPAAVRAARAGRPGLLARLAQAMRRRDAATEPIAEFSPALYAATLCEEAPLAWDRAAAPSGRRRAARATLATRPARAFFPFSRNAALSAGLFPLCRDWPAPVRSEPPAAPPPTPVPVLALSGVLDLRTPVEAARRLATTLGNATVVTAPRVGHSVFGADLDDCATRSVAAFLRGRLPACARATG